MKIGKKIKGLRLKKSVTQEQMAAALNLTAQAISKWENDVTLPDIQMLPEISAYLGVTIDDLFDLSEEKHLERIDNMIWNDRVITRENFDYAESYLKNRLENCGRKEEGDKIRAKVLRMLAELHVHEMNYHGEQAEYYAKEALEAEPEEKGNHSVLREAQHGAIADWNIANHHKRIAYYQKFVQEHPNYARGYLWLLDDLIDDGRVAEAEEVLEKLKTVDNDCRVDMYEGLIAWEKGNHEKAFEIWQSMIEKYPDNWLVYTCAADYMTKAERYDKALEYNRKAIELQPSPKYTDGAMCIAHIYEIMGEYGKAIKGWEEVIELLAAEWQITEGESVDAPRREIERLKKMLD